MSGTFKRQHILSRGYKFELHQIKLDSRDDVAYLAKMTGSEGQKPAMMHHDIPLYIREMAARLGISFL